MSDFFRISAIAGVLAIACLGARAALAQQRPSVDVFSGQQGGYPPSAPVDQPAHIENSVVLDRVVAVINGDVILESDVLEEERFVELQPYRSPGEGTAEQQALQHLINRTLILQQIREQQNPLQVTDAELNKQLDDLRKHLPACAAGRCASDTGWKSLLAAHGFTRDQFDHRWRQRMLVLSFIEQRFRAGVRISKPEIQAYYNDSFVTQFRRRKLTAPPLATVSARIDEILLQEHVNGLLAEWLNSLKDQGSVAILDPKYAAVGPPTTDEDSQTAGDDQ